MARKTIAEELMNIKFMKGYLLAMSGIQIWKYQGNRGHLDSLWYLCPYPSKDYNFHIVYKGVGTTPLNFAFPSEYLEYF